MKIKHLVQKTSEVISPYTGVPSVEKQLLDNSFLVVMDNDAFAGILTPGNIAESSHLIVTDCLNPMPQIDCEQETELVSEIMAETENTVLPVFKKEKFIGVVILNDITEYMSEYRKELQLKIHEHTEALSEENARLQAESDKCKQTVKALQKTCNELEELLEQLVSELKAANTELKNKIKEVKLAEQTELQHKKLNNALVSIVSNVANEISKPNNFIMLNTPLLQKIWKSVLPILDDYYSRDDDFEVAGCKYPAIRERFLKICQNVLEGSHRIQHVADSLIRFSQESTDETSDKLNVNSVVRSSINLVDNLVKKSTDKFVIDLGQLPEIPGNHNHLEQIVVNLIQNACQAIPEKDKALVISTSHDEFANTVEIRVHDEGIGISPESLPQILDSPHAPETETDRTRLGLLLSKQLVKDIGGRLELSSTPGKGTTAKIVLPVNSGNAETSVHFPFL
ncbi:MAG: hypothetical protein GY795_23505 [Desulfobacterales bacterium]|nr:hypothetical protein [Desulfobacterales bacterium]